MRFVVMALSPQYLSSVMMEIPFLKMDAMNVNFNAGLVVKIVKTGFAKINVHMANILLLINANQNVEIKLLHY